MRAIAGPRYLDGDWHGHFQAGLRECSDIVPPVRFVEVDGEEVARVVAEQWISANDVITSQVLEDHGIRYRDQHTPAAIRAFDAGLLAHAGAPLVCTCWGVARLARTLTLPTHCEDVRAASEQSCKYGQLF